MRFRAILAFSGLLAAVLVSQAADDKTKAKPAPAKRETVAKPMSDRQKRAAEDKLRKELETPYKKWLNEEVLYIITDEERKAFSRLQTDEERQQFIEQFWFRPDPTPDTEENEYREEHYRRIAMPTTALPPAFPAGRRTVDEFTSRSDLRMSGKSIPPAVTTSGLLKKAAALPPRFLSKNGATATWKAWATTSLLNLSIPA